MSGNLREWPEGVYEPSLEEISRFPQSDSHLWEPLEERIRHEKQATQRRLTLAEKRSKPSFGFVYLIEAEGSGRFKIGLTKRTPDYRLKQIANSSPFPLKLVAFIESNDSVNLERLWHQRFSDYRVFNEWFELTPERVEEFVGAAQEVAK